MTRARVRACSRFASRAMKPGASASWRSNTLRLTTMIVSIVGGTDWAIRRSGGQAVSNPTAMPTARPPVRPCAVALLDQVNALVQRIGHVACGVVPPRKIQGRVHPPAELPQPAGCERATFWRPRVSSGRETPSEARHDNGNNVEHKRRATALHKNVARRREKDATVS